MVDPIPPFKDEHDAWNTLSHEPSVGHAADAAGRIGSNLNVAVATYGAGALNMVNAVA